MILVLAIVLGFAVLVLYQDTEIVSETARADSERDRANFNKQSLLAYGRHTAECSQLVPFDSPYDPYACDCYLSDVAW